MEFSRQLHTVLLSLAVLLAGSAQAAVFTADAFVDAVDANPGDGVCASAAGNCTLRAAVQETNALAGADTINLPAGTYNLTLAGAQEDLSAAGDLDIRDDLTIVGGTLQTPADTVIDAGGSGGALQERVFHIVESPTLSLTVSFQDLTMANGYQLDGVSGGGNLCISCQGNDVIGGAQELTGELAAHNVTLQYVTIQGGFDYAGGAGIMNTTGTLLIEDSTITGNRTAYQPATATAASIGGGSGGGLSNIGGTVTIRRTVISNNQAQTGGGLTNEDRSERRAVLLLENSQVTNNTAFQGGGLYSSSGNWDMEKRTLFDYGVRLSQSTISNNTTETAGGGIYNFALGSMLITNSTISGNQAQDLFGSMGMMDGFEQIGGGIYHAGTVIDVIGSTVAGNRVGGGGGGGMGGGGMGGGGTVAGHELFINTSNVARSSFPLWLSFQGTILGDPVSGSDACAGTTGFTAYVTDAGGNTVADATCGVVTSAKPRAKANVRRSADVADTLKLGPLANNGGLPGQALPDGTYPLTRALLPGSSAIGAGENCSRIDQRGFARGVASCDAGAYQVETNTKGYANPPENLAPVAKDDYFVTPVNQQLSVKLLTLLANDVDPDADVLQIEKESLVGQTLQQGTVELAGSAEHFFHYQPPAGFVGEDSFSYHISDGELTAVATVRVSVQAGNQAPEATDVIGLTVAPGDSLDIVLDGSKLVSDKNGDALSYLLQTEPTQGMVTETDTGFRYTANSDASGSDVFSYRANDSEAVSEPARVLISIMEPIEVSAMDYPLTVTAGKIVHGKLTDAAGESPFYTYLLDRAGAEKGRILWFDLLTGEFLYQANSDAAGSEQVAYQVKSTMTSSGGKQYESANARVMIEVNADASANQAPVAERADLGVINAGEEVELTLSGSDADGDDLHFTVVDSPAFGDVEVVNPATGLIKLKPNRHVVVGRDRFTFRVSDGLAESAPVQVAFSIAHDDNQTPVASADSAGTPGDMSLIIDVLANDSDADQDELSIELEASSSDQGGLLERVAGRVRYTPPPGYAGSDGFRYRASDGMSESDPVSVTINVIEPSEAPLAPVLRIDSIWSAASTVGVSEASTAVSASDGRGGLGGFGPAGLLLFTVFGWLFRIKRLK